MEDKRAEANPGESVIQDVNTGAGATWVDPHHEGWQTRLYEGMLKTFRGPSWTIERRDRIVDYVNLAFFDDSERVDHLTRMAHYACRERAAA